MLCLAGIALDLCRGAGLRRFEPVTKIAAADTGLIEGKVTDELGKPLDGAVISALGGTTAFAVSDKTGQYSLKQLPPGPYLVRVHLAGFPRGAQHAWSTCGRRRAAHRRSRCAARDPTDAPRITEASVGAIGAAPATRRSQERRSRRDRTRLAPASPEARRVARRAKRLPAFRRTMTGSSPTRFEFLGRAVGTSARAATALFSDLSLGGQVNLLTTGAFDNPLQLLQLDRTSSVAFFSVGAPVGTHGDWNVRAAMNQSDLSSWMLAGSYVVKAQVPHQYQFGMSYSLQRYEGGNTAALGAVSDTARNVGSMFAYDEWQVSRYIAVGYGASYARYDYMEGSAFFSPRLVGDVLAVARVARARTRRRATSARRARKNSSRR